MKLLLLTLLISLTSTNAKQAPRRRGAFTSTGANNGPKAQNVEIINETKSLSNAQLAICGAAASIVGISAMNPVDCIKTLQQSNEGKGLSFVASITKINEEKGLSGFYNGLGPAVTTDVAVSMIKFPIYESLKKKLAKYNLETNSLACFACAILASLVATIAQVPGEVVKQRMQMGHFDSMIGGFTTIFQQSGIKGLFAGLSGVCLRDIPFTMFQLGIYDTLKPLFIKMREGGNLTQLDEILAGAITGGITGFLTAPCDLIKTKLMLNPEMYAGIVDCFNQILQDEGPGGLLNGAAARVAWLTPYTAIYLPMYEVMKRKLILMKSR